MRAASVLVAAFTLNALWQDLVLGAAAALMLRALRRYDARLKHAVALACLAVMIGAPLSSAARSANPPAPRPPFASTTARPAAVAPAAVGGARTESPGLTTGPAPIAVLSVAIMGVVLLRLTCIFRSARRASHLIRRSPVDRRSGLAAVLAECRARWPGIPEVTLHLSADADVPFVWGTGRPAILLPMRLANEPLSVVRPIIAHEVAHVARWDVTVHLAAELASALVIFHPAAWWLKRRIALYREIACDRLAISVLELAPEQYARTLVHAASLSGGLAVAAAPGFGGSVLEQRVKDVLSRSRPKQTTLALRVRLGAAVAALLVVCVAPAFTVEVQQRAGGGIEGHWRLDPSRTRVPPHLELSDLRLDIVAYERGLLIHQLRQYVDGAREEFDLRIPTDGTAVTLALPGGHTARTRATWQGDRLVAESTYLAEPQTEHDEVSSDGQALTLTGFLGRGGARVPFTYTLTREVHP